MFKKCVLTLSENDFKLLHSLIAFGNLLHNLGPPNFIDCWHKVNLYAGEIRRPVVPKLPRVGTIIYYHSLRRPT